MSAVRERAGDASGGGGVVAPTGMGVRSVTSDHSNHDDARDALRTWLRLLACANLVEREVRARLRDEFGTTLPRFDVLAQLDAAARDPASAGGLTMSELSRRLMVSNGNLTGLVERLAEERLVTRGTAAHDRRTQIVRLTPAGKAALDAMTPAHQAWIARLFGGLAHDDRARLHALLGTLKDSIAHTLMEEHPS